MAASVAAEAPAPADASRAAPRVSPFNPANAVTASRFLTLPAFIWAVQHGYHQYATLFMLICGVLDKLDGLVARIFNCRSTFGEVFDAITDGICYGTGLIVVIAYHWAPALPGILVLVLGVSNTALRFVYSWRAGRTVNYKSYAMERVVGYTAFMIGFATAQFETYYFYWAFVPVFAIVVLHDTKRMLIDPVPPPEPAPAGSEVAA